MAKLHQGVFYRRVAMRVILHGCAHDVGHLIEMTVIDSLHGVENTPLHRLEAILDIRDSTLENHVRGIFKKPCLIHTAQMMSHHILG